MLLWSAIDWEVSFASSSKMSNMTLRNKEVKDVKGFTFPPPLGPTRATFDPGFSFSVIP